MAIDKKKVKTLIGIGGVALGAAFIGMEALAKKRNEILYMIMSRSRKIHWKERK